MILLNIDLDNTLIYSYKHDIGTDKIPVEIYEGREISFMTGTTFRRLQKIRDKVFLVPTSTRSIEQYNRIDLRIGDITYALVCNGGVLLVNGKKDPQWYEASVQIVKKSISELMTAFDLLEKDPRRKFELRFIEELFLFTKCDNPENVVADLRQKLNNRMVDVFHNKEKVYVIPAGLTKGNAIMRLRNLLHPDFVIASGDSEFDISMLHAADIGIAPHSFRETYDLDFPLEEMSGRNVFSDELTETLLRILQIENGGTEIEKQFNLL